MHAKKFRKHSPRIGLRLSPSEALRLRLCTDYRRTELPTVGGRHSRLFGYISAIFSLIWLKSENVFSPRSAPKQRLQPVPGHVVRRGDRLRQPLRDVPVQRGRGHQRPDPECGVYVPDQCLGGYFSRW